MAIFDNADRCEANYSLLEFIWGINCDISFLIKSVLSGTNFHNNFIECFDCLAVPLRTKLNNVGLISLTAVGSSVIFNSETVFNTVSPIPNDFSANNGTSLGQWANNNLGWVLLNICNNNTQLNFNF